MSYGSRVTLFVCIGIVVQVSRFIRGEQTVLTMSQIIVTIGTWLMCRKYHPTFGIPGTGLPDGSVEEQMWWLNQGWEWWPTLFWQFIWTWVRQDGVLKRPFNIC
jgi:hypothetical protein